MIVTRFAPSPTGRLHEGHAFSALFAWAAVRAGRFLLRIEDIDQGRCRPEFEQGIYDDLAWLGLDWERPVRRQSEHMGEYRAALDRLDAMGVLYPCFCTRADIARAGAAPHGPEGPLYPGTCRGLSPAQRRDRIAAGTAYALRLDAAKAAALTGPLDWHDREAGRVACDPLAHGDVVLARKDVPASYHLAVTHDDALQGVTLVTRGRDLFHATHVHRLLQALLGWPTPDYHHHRLIMDADGARLAKRAGSPTLTARRAAGESAESLGRRLGF